MAEVLYDSVSPPSPVSSGAAVLDLSHQQRNLLLLSPLFQLSANRFRLGGELRNPVLDVADTNYMCLRLFDYLIEGAPLQGGRTRRECMARLVECATEMAPLGTQAQLLEVAEIVLGALENSRDHYREFEERYFHAPSRQAKTFRFRLIALELTADDAGELLKLTAEGHIAYLAMLDLPADVGEEILQKASQLMFERGRYQDALTLIQQARRRSALYRTELRDYVEKVVRNPREVNWVNEVEPRISEARQHVDQRRQDDARMLSNVTHTLAELGADDSEGARQLRAVRDELDEANTLRVQLFNVLQNARARFFEANARLLVVRKRQRVGSVPQVLSPGLGALSTQDFALAADEAFWGLFPVEPRRLLDLETLTAMVRCRPAPSIEPAEDTVDEEAQVPVFVETYSAEVDDAVKAFVARLLREKAGGELRTLLAEPELATLTDSEQRLAVAWLYRYFTASPEFEVTVDGEYRNAILAGSHLVFKPTSSP